MVIATYYYYIPPILYAAFCYSSGIWLQWLWVYSFFLFFSICLIIYGYTRNLRLTFFCLLALAGAARYQMVIHRWYRYAHAIHKQQCSTFGYIQDIVHNSTPEVSTKMRCVITDPDCSLYHKTILVYTKSHVAAHAYDIIQLNNITLTKPSNERFCNYLIKESIATTIFAQRSAIRIIEQQNFWAAFAALPTTALYSLQTKMNQQTFSFFSSLFMGKRSQETAQTQSDFKKWGIAHYIARSGLHLAIVAAFWEIIIRCIPLSWYYRQWLVSIIIFLYFLLTWASTSFIRSISTYFMIKIYALNKKQHHFLHILSSVWLAFLLYNPLYLFFLDFQLTFLLTGALTWFATVTMVKIKLLPRKQTIF